MPKKAAPAGSWPSPITSDLIVAANVRLAQPCVDGGVAYWLEGRPQEKGRVVLVSDAHGRRRDLTPKPFSVRSRAQEYGGGAYTISDGRIWFVNAADQCVYEVENGTCHALTAAGERRYADLKGDARRERLIAACEDHSAAGEPRNTLVAIALADGHVTTLAQGADFFSSPTLSPDGRQLAYLSWEHPDMPWDETALWLAKVGDDGTFGATRRVGRTGASIFQPLWGPDGALYYAADYTDWWNLYRFDGETETAIAEDDAEYAMGQWIFGLSTFAFLDARTIVAITNRRGEWSLTRVDVASRTTSRVQGFDYPACEHIHSANGRTLVLAGNPHSASSVIEVRLEGARAKCETLAASSTMSIAPDTLSTPESIRFASGEGDHAYGFYYAPKNPGFERPAGEEPPLIVTCHGGPTAATSTALEPRIQFWTSRGFAVLDVNYRGSTGYGRHYRQKLYANWGIADVDDCVNGARALIDRGLADPKRCVIRGSSAGGYTVLATLAFRDQFAAGASLYGIGDLALLATDTHKFEAHYTDRLVGPYPQAKDIYAARSPLYHADKIRAPVIFFQGLDDNVVPPNQAEAMVAALKKRGVPVAHVTFEGEGHGFRNAANIKYSLDAELAFYGRVLGFRPAGPGVDLDID